MIAKTIYQRLAGRIVLPALFLFMVNAGAAQIVLPGCFTDNMVLQQQTKVNLWGTQTQGKSLAIITSWNNKTYKVMADAHGDWKTSVSTPVYGGPYTITFKDGITTTTLKNIMVGEVWVCSGQSNM